MARLNRDQLGPKGQKAPGPGGNDDFLGRLNETIKNIKGLIEMLPPGTFPGLGTIPGQQTGQKAPGPGQAAPVVIDGMPPGGKGAKGAPPVPPASIQLELFQVWLKQNGDKTIGELLKELEPVTLKEIAKGLKNVGLIK